MPRNDYGQVDINLDGQDFTLVNSISAMQKIDRYFGSIRAAAQSVSNLSLDGVCFVVAAGAGVGKEQSKQLPALVFATGIGNVAVQISEYLGMMLNPTGEDRDEGGGREGEAKAGKN
jgi:hypothetical protein